MWAIARHDLRLSEEEFWRLTLYKFRLLFDRYMANVRIRYAAGGNPLPEPKRYNTAAEMMGNFRAYQSARAMTKPEV